MKGIIALILSLLLYAAAEDYICPILAPFGLGTFIRSFFNVRKRIPNCAIPTKKDLCSMQQKETSAPCDQASTLLIWIPSQPSTRNHHRTSSALYGDLKDFKRHSPSCKNECKANVGRSPVEFQNQGDMSGCLEKHGRMDIGIAFTARIGHMLTLKEALNV